MSSYRYYENEYPNIGDIIMVKVKEITNIGIYVSLLEYDNIEGMISTNELSRQRIRSINNITTVNKHEVVTVVNIDDKNKYVDLSKRLVTLDDINKCEERYNKSKIIHRIMIDLSTQSGISVEELNKKITWPIFKKYK
jgi:translation initiation factor 2 subunit 1